MQTRNPFLDDLSKIASSAAGSVMTISEEVRSFFNAQAERLIADLDLVRRDEYENALNRIALLEEKLAKLGEAAEKPKVSKPETSKAGASKKANTTK